MVLESKIDDFLSEIRLGVDFFFSAGQKLVLMLEEDPRVFEEIIERSKLSWVTMDVLKGFEMIGRKQLAVEAMFLPKHILNRMIGLPLDDQERMLSSPVNVSIGLRRGNQSRVGKALSKLSRNEAKRVIGPAGIRTVEEQDALPSKPPEKVIGRFSITVMNGKAFIKRTSNTFACQKLRLDKNNTVEIEFIQSIKNP